jgi:cell division protein FtsQ
LAAAVVVVVIGIVFYATPLLGVASVRVVGARLVTTEEVQAAARVVPGTPLARVDLGAVERQVDQLVPVRATKASRAWPDTLVIRVYERTAIAAVALESGGFGLIDASGMLFTTTTRRDAGLALLRLSSPGPADQSTRDALTVLAALTPQLRERLTELVADTPARIRLELSGGREIIWGDATENDDKARVATYMLSRPGKVIDVSAPRFVTVR